jgi:hypothetical protein
VYSFEALISPMIVEIEPITPHQRGNTQDPSEKIFYRIENRIEGSYIGV